MQVNELTRGESLFPGVVLLLGQPEFFAFVLEKRERLAQVVHKCVKRLCLQSAPDEAPHVFVMGREIELQAAVASFEIFCHLAGYTKLIQ